MGIFLWTIVVVLVGWAVGAYLVHRQDQKEVARQDAARQKQLDDAAEWQRQEQAKRQAAADEFYESAQRRKRQLEEEERQRERDQARQSAMGAIDNAIEYIKKLYDTLIELMTSQRETEVNFDLPRFHPFWDSAYRTFNLMQQAESCLSSIAWCRSTYYSNAAKYPGTLPPFINLDGIEEAPPIIDAVRRRLADIVDRAHGVPDFSNAYSTMRLESAIKQGFSQLGAKLDRIEYAVHQNTRLITARLADISMQINDLNRSIDEGNRYVVNNLTSMGRDIEQGMRSATAALDSNHRAAQKRADKAILELKQIKYRVS